jgi:hypothetical protein
MKEEFKFTPDNLIDNLDKLGGWSAYGLASEALQHYFPDEYLEDESPSVEKEIELVKKLGLNYWDEVIIKYHKEVGYKGEFNPGAVNEY